MRARLCLAFLLVSSLALAGCGRRGPLEPPEGVVQEKPVTTPGKPRPENSTEPEGLFRNTSNKSEDPTLAGTPQRPKPRATGPFVLDPLL